MKTDITDNYPYLGKLECQCYSFCDKYEPERCQFDKPCQAYIVVDGKKGMSLRRMFRYTIEKYVFVENIKLQIDLIRQDDSGLEDELEP